MIVAALLTVALAGAAQAQNTTVRLMLPAADDQKLVGSVVKAEADATTYVVECSGLPKSMPPHKRQNAMPASTASAASSQSSGDSDSDSDSGDDNDNGDDGGFDSSECGFPVPVTIIEGPSTLHFSAAYDSLTNIVDCKLSGTTGAICTGTYSGSGYSDNSGVSSATLAGSDLPPQLNVVITAGAEKLKATSSSGSSSGSSSASSTASGADTATTQQAGGSSGTAGGASPSSTGTGGGMQVEPTMALGMAGGLAIGVAAMLL